MKSMKGKIMKKLKSIKPIGYLKVDRILQVNASDGFVETFFKSSNLEFQPQSQKLSKDSELKKKMDHQSSRVAVQEPDIIDVTELMKDIEDDDEIEFDQDMDDKENIGPPPPMKKAKDPVVLVQKDSGISKISESENVKQKQTPLSEIDISSFRRPDLNSGTLFDPNLLAAFEQALNQHVKITEATKEISKLENCEEPPSKVQKTEEINDNPLLIFEEKCPPGGNESVVFYTTSLRGIRKTFEDCNSVRFLLESFRVLFYERDISMHSEFREELWRILDGKKGAVPPRLFIKGRYIGGAEEVLVLHEQGKLRRLFDGVPVDRTNGQCDGCAGIRFVVCFKCSGSHKVVDDNDDGSYSKCPECNENGLIICPICC